MKKYTPPFILTNEILGLVSSIMEKVGRINSFDNLSKLPKLRKQNRVKSIQSSCSIEANSLSFEQVTDVINGRKVIGPQKDIIEIQNAIKAYSIAFNKDPFSEDDLRFVHSIMTENLIKSPGKYRMGGEGVIDESGKVIFIAPPAKMVSELMSNLFNWGAENFKSLNTLILSSIFHYEFVFIHPFSDGNGRMARLWQNLILAKWKPIFEFIPIESMIKNYQKEYYDAIASSNSNGDSTTFVTFMLKMIDLAVNQLIIDVNDNFENDNKYVNRLLQNLRNEKWYSSKEIQKILDLKDSTNFRQNYLLPALKTNQIVMEYPDKPTSKNQRYKKNI